MANCEARSQGGHEAARLILAKSEELTANSRAPNEPDKREHEFAFLFHVEQCYACAGRSGATLGCWPGAGFSTCCTSSLGGGGTLGLTRAGSSLPSISNCISLASSTSRSSKALAIATSLTRLSSSSFLALS